MQLTQQTDVPAFSPLVHSSISSSVVQLEYFYPVLYNLVRFSQRSYGPRSDAHAAETFDTHMLLWISDSGPPRVGRSGLLKLAQSKIASVRASDSEAERPHSERVKSEDVRLSDAIPGSALGRTKLRLTLNDFGNQQGSNAQGTTSSVEKQMEIPKPGALRAEDLLQGPPVQIYVVLNTTLVRICLDSISASRTCMIAGWPREVKILTATLNHRKGPR